MLLLLLLLLPPPPPPPLLLSCSCCCSWSSRYKVCFSRAAAPKYVQATFGPCPCPCPLSLPLCFLLSFLSLQGLLRRAAVPSACGRWIMMIMNFDDDDSQNRVNDHDRLDGYNHHDNHYYESMTTPSPRHHMCMLTVRDTVTVQGPSPCIIYTITI